MTRAKAASQAIVSSWSADEELNRRLLLAELTPCLEVFVSCGIALDALYDQLRPHAKLETDTLRRWRDNKTSRAKRVAEVVRRVFALKDYTHSAFAGNIGEIFKWRNQAVHPSLELKRSCNRPDIPVGVDWKFSFYRYSNSDAGFRSVMEMLTYLHKTKCAEPRVNDQIESVFQALQELGVSTFDGASGQESEPG